MKSHEELTAEAREKEAKDLAAIHKRCATCTHWRPIGSTVSSTRKCCHCILDTGHSRKKISARKCGSWKDRTKETDKKGSPPVF